MSNERERLKLVVDDGQTLKMGWALRYHAQRLLIDCDKRLLQGEHVTLIPICDNPTLDMREIPAVVAHIYEDSSSGRPEQRFMASLVIDAGPLLHASLRDEIDRSCLASLQRGPQLSTHGPDVLDTSRWAT